MGYHNRQNWKKRIAGGIALLIALVMVMGLLAPFAYGAPMSASNAIVSTTGDSTDDSDYEGLEDELKEWATADIETIGEERFDVNLEVGLPVNGKSTYIIGRMAPALGVITNKGAAFKGRLEIKTYLSSVDTGAKNEGQSAIYYQELELSQGASKKIDMELGLGAFFKFVEVSLVDDNGNEVYSQRLNIQPKDISTMAFGVLSDKPSQLQSLSQMVLGENVYYNEDERQQYQMTVYLTDTSFPQSKYILDNFRVILIDGFDTRSLTEAQVTALEAWVMDGGVLMLGTGSNVQNVMAGLPFLSDVEVNGTSVVSDVTAFHGDGVVAGDLTVADLQHEKLTTVWKQGDTALASQMPYRDGIVVFAHYTLSLAPMAGSAQSGTIVQELLQQVAGEQFVEQSESGYYYGGESYYASRFPMPDATALNAVFGVIFGYIIVIGPLLYFILKKKDKRELAWGIIPVASILGMALVFFAAGNSGYKNGILRSVSTVMLDQDSTQGQGKVQIAFKNANNGDVTFFTEEELSVIPTDYWVSDQYYRMYENVSKESYRVRATEGTEITFPDVPSWETNSLSTEKVFDMGGNVTCEVSIANNRYVGTLTNSTDTDFIDVVLLVGGKYITIGDVNAGQSITVDEPVEVEDGKSVYDLYYQRDEYYDDVENGLMTEKEAYRLYQEAGVLQNITNNGNRIIASDVEESLQIHFVGFTEQSLLEDTMRVNGKAVPSTHLTAYLQTFVIDYSLMKEVTLRSQVIVDGAGISSGYGFANSNSYVETSSIYLSTSAELDYTMQVPKTVRIETLFIDQSEDYMLEGFGMVSPSSYTLLNVETGEWDTVEARVPVDASNYIDQQGVLSGRFKGVGEQDVEVPYVEMEGGGVYAGN